VINNAHGITLMNRSIFAIAKRKDRIGDSELTSRSTHRSSIPPLEKSPDEKIGREKKGQLPIEAASARSRGITRGVNIYSSDFRQFARCDERDADISRILFAVYFVIRAVCRPLRIPASGRVAPRASFYRFIYPRANCRPWFLRLHAGSL